MKTLIRLAVAAGALLLTLAFAEAAVRILELEPPPLWRFDRTVGWTYQPGLRTWYATREFRSWVEINSRGLHDRERAYAKAAGVFRILMLGDSFTAALEVPFAESYSRLLERRLQGAGRFTVEVINAGVGGYSTVNELLLFRHEGVRYRPDLVVLNLNDADIRDNDHAIADNGVAGAPYFELTDGGLALRHYPDTALSWLKRRAGHVRLTRLAYRAAVSLGTRRASATAGDAARKAVGQPPPVSSLYREPRGPDWTRAVEITKALIRVLHGEVTRAGGRLAVVTLLSGGGASGGQPGGDATAAVASFERELTEFFDSLAVSHLHLRQRLSDEERAGRPVRFAVDRHFNAHGHRVVAALLERFLMRHELIAARSGA